MNEPAAKSGHMTPAVIECWLQFMESGDSTVLHDLLHPDATFYSPAVFTPQAGRSRVQAYLVAAEKMFAGSSFTYTDRWYRDSSALLEFEVELSGVRIEGVDLIQWNSDGQITIFKVIIRPLRGLQTVVDIMGALLGRQTQADIPAR